MVDVFNDIRYAIQYEQVTLDLGGTYRQFASDTLSLIKIPKNSKVLDLGCGTGISTCTIFDMAEKVKVTGVDKAQHFLDIALLKFGLLDNPNSILQIIKQDHPYPQVLRDKCDVKDLESHLKKIAQKYKKFGNKVSFYHKDASEILDIKERPFDYVLANQVIHWFRKKDTKSGEPNLDYERTIIQQVRNSLKEGSLFGFNTSGADYKFDKNDMNQIHILNHPFYIAFMESLHYQLSSKWFPKREYTFDHNEIKRIMEENGFNIEASKQKKMYRQPNQIIEVCIVGGQMQIFQKSNVESTTEERERILEEALKYALRKSSPGVKPVIETGIHYIARKI
ncbi:hypothetical protein AYK26_02060 [Euryarchaeota archaeon SM23-78]|nr:MAG: hypothetical protein AYK26_02060 [Euryarchaeota archaeon SM23-78]MBW3000368.1 class I SAM-dependent methyltransferase [Candidatus Woesearchaeota archaeon]